jgi:hypothetical protein
VSTLALPATIGHEWGLEVADGTLFVASADAPVQAAFSVPPP